MDLEELPLARNSIRCCSCRCSSCNGCSSPASWARTVKRKYDELEGIDSFSVPGLELDYPSVAKIHVENEIDVLREMVSDQQEAIQDLCLELEEERNASSSAANETMSMILRLQKEKAESHMEARQFKRFAEEKMSHDQEELEVLEDLLYKREQLIQSLTCEVQAYKHRMMSYGLTDAEIDGEKSLVLAGNQSMVEILDEEFESPNYDYPPLICYTHETLLEIESEVTDVEKYAFDDVPLSREEQLKSLEDRIDQMETTSTNNQLDEDSSGGKNILEKVVDGHSPRDSRHSRKFSFESSSSQWAKDCPMPTTDVKRMDYVSQNKDETKSPVHASEFGVDGGDRVYTLVSTHDCVTAPREMLNRVNSEDPDIQKLHLRLQALEADRESLRHTIISMRTDTAQLVLLKEIAQHLWKDTSPERDIVVKKPTVSRTFSFISIFKWIASSVLWRNRSLRTKYLLGLSASSVGLLMLLDKNPCKKPWRFLTKRMIIPELPCRFQTPTINSSSKEILF